MNLLRVRFIHEKRSEFALVKQALILTDLSDSALAQAQAAVQMLNLSEVHLTLGFIREPSPGAGGVLMRVGDVLKEQAERELRHFSAKLPSAELMVDRWRVFQQQIRSGVFDLVIQTTGHQNGVSASLPKHLLEHWGVPVLSFPATSTVETSES
jgi:hypothetical protein